MNDLISRADAIERFCECGTSLERQGKTIITMVDAKYAFIETLESLPSAEPKTGEWVKVIDEETPNLTKWHYECDQCGAGRWEEGQRYCQNCGAMMIREDGEA